MSIRSGARGDARLLGYFLLPSWLSTLVSAFVGVMVIGGTIALTHFGGVVQQGLFGLHSAYRQSSAAAVAGHFARNAVLGNVVFFLSWGLVGLVIYSVVHGFVRNIGRAQELSRTLKYAQANRHAVLKNIGARTAIRIAALIALLLGLRFVIYKVIPYGIVSAHMVALHFTSATDWLYGLLAGAVCVVCVHLLTVLLRLLFLRPRLWDSQFVI